MSWDSKVVVVTGGAMGIGRYIALGCAERGAKVAIADIDDEGLKAVESELARYGQPAFARHVDVQDEWDVRGFMAEVRESLGGIDYLVNNAAIVPHFQWGGPRWSPVRDLDYDFWARVIGTNLTGTFLCSKHVIPHMEQAEAGHIVNLYGGGGLTPPGALAYVVTKEAGVAFTRYLAEEVRDHNICVMSISPGGAIATERAPDEARARMPGPQLAGERYFLAAEAGMELSGHLVDLREGILVAIN